MKRVSIVGNSGSGKSHLARELALLMHVPHVELDALYHGPNWEPAAPAAFLARVASVAARETWVIDGNYRDVTMNGPVWARADTVVWLDLPRSHVMRQVAWRTLKRFVTRETLWNGNRERFRDMVSWNPDRSIVRWAWTQHAAYRTRYVDCMRSASFAHLCFVRLASRGEARDWLDAITRERAAAA